MKKAKTTNRHYFALPEEAVGRIDALAVADGMTHTRGSTLAKAIAKAARSVGINVADAPTHRTGPIVRCDPERPYARLIRKHPNGEPFPIYADIDGRAGLALALIAAQWKVSREEAVERIAKLATGGAA